MKIALGTSRTTVRSPLCQEGAPSRVSDPPLKGVGLGMQVSKPRLTRLRPRFGYSPVRPTLEGQDRRDAMPVSGAVVRSEKLEGLERCRGHDKPFQHCRGKRDPRKGCAP